MSIEDTIATLSRTTRGKVVIVALALYAIIILGDGLARFAGFGPYPKNYAGEVIAKHQSFLGWTTYIVSGRTLWGKTDRATRKVPIGPWRVVVKQAGGKTIEVAVPKNIWTQAAPGMKLRARLDPAFANFSSE